ncbi:DUF2721 domain-containing protein [Solimicrobium silvestre]|uniref:DUF2721 domain-containing protein n=1 Tax=Solimicrobium silvestre TaxID=2099400 RepID=A0A2S9H2J4_9BURK|nr:DUF2721 domain-containing protein [Solimicrobium silvestre]PRC94180.1 hypothetical protein S2091_1353 [Solimicrobium silvestre]
MNIQLDDIGKIIQLSIAPVFMLSGVGTHLIVLTNRLARIIDRSRKLEETLTPEALHHDIELDELYARSHLINRSITLSCLCALLICLVIATLFVSDALEIALAKPIASMFVLGILSLIGSFVYFLREIFVATRTLERDRLRRGGGIIRSDQA